MTFIKKNNSFIAKSGRKLNTSRMEGVTLDSFYFTEYGIEYGNVIYNIFKKTQKSDKLHADLQSADLSLRGRGMVAVASFLGYSLDKIFNMFISKKDNQNFIRLTTIDGFSIEVTDGMEILTKEGYKKACDIKQNDLAMIVLSSSFSFKSGGEDSKHIDINSLITSIALKFGKKEKILLKTLENYEFKTAYFLGLNTDKEGYIYAEDFKKAQKFFSDKKKKITGNTNKKDLLEEIEEEEENQLGKLFQNNAFEYKKIIKIEKNKKSNIVVININSLIAENLIVNNFIIKQNC